MNETTIHPLVTNAKLFIFDMDGTLVDLEKLNYYCFSEAFKRLANYEINNEIYQTHLSGRKNEDGFAHVFQMIGRSDLTGPDGSKVFREIKTELLEKDFSSYVQVKPHAEYFLNLLKAKLKYSCVATSTIRKFTEIILDKTGLLPLVEFIVTADDITHGKPDPEVFLKCCEHFGTAPQASLVFEDSLNGINAAKNGKIPVIGIHNKGQNDSFVHEATAVIDDFNEVIEALQAIS